jgi:hypothetical protein
MSLLQPFTSIVALDVFERMRPGELALSGKSRVWIFKQRPRGLCCAWEGGCENEAVHLDSRDSQIGYCVLHHLEEEDNY